MGFCASKCTVEIIKSRVSPVKKMTIHRLELMEAAIGVRLTDILLKSIEFENVQTWYWIDSTTVLSWIQK